MAKIKRLILPLFFALLLVMIFMGDGKQHPVEVVAGASTLLMYGLFWWRARRHPPLPFGGLWLLVLLVVGVAGIFSDSPGYSLSLWLRFLEGYLIYSLMFWGTSGLLLGKSKMSPPKPTAGFAPEKAIAAAAAFLVITQGLSAAFSQTGNPRAAFFLAPQLEKRAREFVRQRQAESKNLTTPEENLIGFFHRRNPDVLFALAQTKAATSQADSAAEFYHQAVLLDPRNFQFYREYINFLLATDHKEEIGWVLNKLWQATIKREDPKPLVNFQGAELVRVYSREVFAGLGGEGLPEEGLAKILYFLGLKFLADQPQTARNLWLMARSLSPEWDYYHLELAALEYYAFDNLSAARLVLANCQRHYYPARSCVIAGRSVRGLPSPGSYKSGVRAIPRPSEQEQK